MPSWRARLMPVATSPLRSPSRTSSRCRCRVAVPQPSGRSPAEIAIELVAAVGMPHRERHADHAAEAGADEGDRRACSRSRRATPPPGRPGRAPRSPAGARPRRSRARSSRCRASTGRAPCSAPGRSGRARRATATTPRVPPCRRPAVAERKRRRGDAADDDDHRRRAELGPVGLAAERHVLERMAVDGHGRTRGRRGGGGRRRSAGSRPCAGD